MVRKLNLSSLTHTIEIMKKILFILALILGVATASANRNYSRDINVLPETAKDLITQNFKSPVNHIRIGREFGRIREYDVVLKDGSEIYFDKKGEWKEIEVGESTSVPSAIVPNPISTYVKTNHNVRVVGIEKTNSGFDVELSNGKEIKFTEKGKFVRYDD